MFNLHSNRFYPIPPSLPASLHFARTPPLSRSPQFEGDALFENNKHNNVSGRVAIKRRRAPPTVTPRKGEMALVPFEASSIKYHNNHRLLEKPIHWNSSLVSGMSYRCKEGATGVYWYHFFMLPTSLPPCFGFVAVGWCTCTCCTGHPSVRGGGERRFPPR